MEPDWHPPPRMGKERESEAPERGRFKAWFSYLALYIVEKWIN